VRARHSVLLLELVAFAAGCGSSEPATVAGRFQDALDAGNGAGACAELSEQTTTKLEDQEQQPCERAILGLGLPHGHVASSQVDVTSASVSLPGGATLFLSEAAGGWEISAAGCRPTAADLPYDCDLED
jgi:hypothetical protein